MNDRVNDTRLEDLFEDVRKLGRDSAEGKDALPKLAMKITAAAADGVIGSDDAKGIYEAYIKAESKKQIHTAAGKEANTSKLKQFINLGLGMHDDGVDLLDRAAEIRNKLAQDDVKVLAAYQAFLAVARFQLSDDAAGLVLSDDVIEELVKKPEPKEKDEAKRLEAIKKSLEKIIEGNKETGEGKYPSPQAEYALDQINNRLSEIAQAAEDEKLAAQLKSRGLSAVPAPANNSISQPEASELDDVSTEEAA
jgi:hypothetical protein